MSLTAAIHVPAGQKDARAFQIKLRITNPTGSKIAVLNPDMGVPPPALKWTKSKETYQTSLLMWHGYLSMAVTDEAGKPLTPQAIATWVTPVVMPDLELAPGASFEITIPLGDFYTLMSGKSYGVALEYGDKGRKVSARTRVRVP